MFDLLTQKVITWRKGGGGGVARRTSYGAELSLEMSLSMLSYSLHDFPVRLLSRFFARREPVPVTTDYIVLLLKYRV